MDADFHEHYLHESSKCLLDWKHNHTEDIWMDTDFYEHYLYDSLKCLIAWKHNHTEDI